MPRLLLALLLLLLPAPVWAQQNLGNVKANQLSITGGANRSLKPPTMTQAERDSFQHENGEIVDCSTCSPVGGWMFMNGIWVFLGGTGGGGGGVTNPAPPLDSVQFNLGGVFGGDSRLLWDSTLHRLQIGTLPQGPLSLGPLVVGIDAPGGTPAQAGLFQITTGINVGAGPVTLAQDKVAVSGWAFRGPDVNGPALYGGNFGVHAVGAGQTRGVEIDVQNENADTGIGAFGDHIGLWLNRSGAYNASSAISIASQDKRGWWYGLHFAPGDAGTGGDTLIKGWGMYAFRAMPNNYIGFVPSDDNDGDVFTVFAYDGLTEKLKFNKRGQFFGRGDSTGKDQPTFTWLDQPNSGMYLTAPNQIGFSILGDERLKIFSFGTLVTGYLASVGTPFSGLSPVVNNGSVIYCSDCQQTTPCTAGGTGAIAQKINTVWQCSGGSSISGSVTGTGSVNQVAAWTGTNTINARPEMSFGTNLVTVSAGATLAFQAGTGGAIGFRAPGSIATPFVCTYPANPGNAGDFLRTDGPGCNLSWATGTGAAGITNLNTLSAFSQTVAPGTTNVNWSSSGSTHTFTWTGTLSPARGGLGTDSSGWTGIPLVTAGAWSQYAGFTCPAGQTATAISASGVLTCAATGAGTVTHTLGALTTNQIVVGNGGGDVRAYGGIDMGVFFAGGGGQLSQDANKFTFDYNKSTLKLGFGGSFATQPWGTPPLMVANQTEIVSNVGTAAPTLALQSSNGSLATPAISAAGDTLGSIDFRGYDGATGVVGARIITTTTAAPTTGVVSSQMKLQASDAFGMHDAITIRPTGNIWLGGVITRYAGLQAANGQLLIGNTSTDAFEARTLSCSGGVTCTPGPGSITIVGPGGGSIPGSTQWTSVTDYGVVKGASTMSYSDPIAVANSTAIVNAVNAACALGGVLYFPPGVYTFNQQIVIGDGATACSGLTVLGGGASGTPDVDTPTPAWAGSVVRASFAGSVFNVFTLGSVNFERLTIVNGTTTGGANVVSLTASGGIVGNSGSKFTNVRLSGGEYGIRAFRAAHVTLDTVYIEGFTGVGVSIESSQNCDSNQTTIVNARIEGSNLTGASTGITNRGAAFTLSGTEIFNVSTGVLHQSGVGACSHTLSTVTTTSTPNGATTVTVSSTSSFPVVGSAKIGAVTFTYNGTTATQFLNVSGVSGGTYAVGTTVTNATPGLPKVVMTGNQIVANLSYLGTDPFKGAVVLHTINQNGMAAVALTGNVLAPGVGGWGVVFVTDGTPGTFFAGVVISGNVIGSNVQIAGGIRLRSCNPGCLITGNTFDGGLPTATAFIDSEGGNGNTTVSNTQFVRTPGLAFKSTEIAGSYAIEQGAPGLTFGNLPLAPTNGSHVFCADCLLNSNPCTGGGTGATATRLASAWSCGSTAVATTTPGAPSGAFQYNNNGAFAGTSRIVYVEAFTGTDRQKIQAAIEAATASSSDRGVVQFGCREYVLDGTTLFINSTVTMRGCGMKGATRLKGPANPLLRVQNANASGTIIREMQLAPTSGSSTALSFADCQMCRVIDVEFVGPMGIGIDALNVTQLVVDRVAMLYYSVAALNVSASLANVDGGDNVVINSTFFSTDDPSSHGSPPPCHICWTAGGGLRLINNKMLGYLANGGALIDLHITSGDTGDFHVIGNSLEWGPVDANSGYGMRVRADGGTVLNAGGSLANITLSANQFSTVNFKTPISIEGSNVLRAHCPTLPGCINIISVAITGNTMTSFANAGTGINLIGVDRVAVSGNVINGNASSTVGIATNNTFNACVLGNTFGGVPYKLTGTGDKNGGCETPGLSQAITLCGGTITVVNGLIVGTTC